ncbi:alpha/beta fold hydrolase [Xanthomonas massiliensis]|jgi:pimeloyl-ACP methyl ester carboxylesterase|uniref:alpha/beta fold hydrolase n=1 Tax=Xanthomonas massiliensis TaxID=1720302 RepID=UPI000826ED10|nr:alpha/beta fold hydrolase [Xanthomonas massiliensis]
MSRPIPLLLLPGLLNDAELWRAQLAALGDIAACQVGDLSRGETLQALAEQVLAGMPERFALAGFSLGGYVAQQILRIAPQRVERLALLDTSARADPPQRVLQRRAQERAVARAPGSFVGFGERLMRSYVAAPRHGDGALLRRVQAMTRRLGPEVFVRQSRIERRDGRAVLAAFAGPALVLCGAEDAITPPALSREIAALMPGARLVVLPACGHLAPLEQPEAVAAAMREWLLR